METIIQIKSQTTEKTLCQQKILKQVVWCLQFLFLLSKYIFFLKSEVLYWDLSYVSYFTILVNLLLWSPHIIHDTKINILPWNIFFICISLSTSRRNRKKLRVPIVIYFPIIMRPVKASSSEVNRYMMSIDHLIYSSSHLAGQNKTKTNKCKRIKSFFAYTLI